jgi:hypothetical protein
MTWEDVPTYLTDGSLKRAIEHLTRFGDTDVFPHLVEIVFLEEMKEKVVQELMQLDLDNFSPAQAVETISPKSRYGFRIVHQPLLLEALLYTAAVVEIADDLETLKRPLDEFGPYGYRFSSEGNGSLFHTDRTYRDWLTWQSAQVASNNYAHVIATDIADFYQRIYMHRIENCLDTATAKKGIKKFIEKLIKQIRSRQSHGIPVGGTASRLIAEAILADSDNALADEDFKCSRFVDDFRIFVQPNQSPYTILAFLADQLAASEGLSLNAQKTRLFSRAEFQTFIDEQMGDAFDDAEQKAIQDLSHAFYFDEEPDEEDLVRLRALNLVGMLTAELSLEIWDFGKIKAIFRALRLAPDADSVEPIFDNFDAFLPFVKELVLYLDKLNTETQSDLGVLREKVLTQMKDGAAATVPSIRVWLLELFVREVFEISTAELNSLRLTESIENRQMYLIRGLNRDVNFFRRQKTRFDERNNYEKSAFILGATCLPKDEFETWIGAIKPNMHRPLERLFCDWVKTKSGKLLEILDARSQLLRD